MNQHLGVIDDRDHQVGLAVTTGAEQSVELWGKMNEVKGWPMSAMPIHGLHGRCCVGRSASL
jgi:hypothetical protein